MPARSVFPYSFPRHPALLAALLGTALVAGPIPATAADRAGTTHRATTADHIASAQVTVGLTPATHVCARHEPENGNWVNVDRNTRGTARIELRDCQSVTICHGNTCTITHNAGWAMRVFGACHPRACDWGWSRSRFRLRSGHVFGFYGQGFARRHIYTMMSRHRPGQLWVHTFTDFTDPRRPDYRTDEWFVRTS